jgi:hypothetical protein
MSRGPGRCQRAILAALEVLPAVTLRSVLGAGFTKPQYIAAWRAMWVLEAKGKISVGMYYDILAHLWHYVLLRPPYTIDDLAVRVGLGLKLNGHPHLWHMPDQPLAKCKHHDDSTMLTLRCRP